MRSIVLKLVLAFLAVSLVSTMLLVVVAGYTTQREFHDYTSNNELSHAAAALEEYYRAEGSWQGVDAARFFWRMPQMHGMGPTSADPMVVADSQGRVVRAGPNGFLGTILPTATLAQGQPVMVDGNIVGYVMIPPAFAGSPDPLANAFVGRVGQLLLYSALGAVGISLLLAIFLSRSLSRPIQELTSATRAIADGDLSHQVPVRSRDELGQLADSFNRMSAQLSRSLYLRRQMTADIAHELRTPLSLILGHAEAVHDGVLAPSAENFEIIREEAGRLEHLVDDLRTLSLADAGELSYSPQVVAIPMLLSEVAARYRYRAQQQGITLEEQLQAGLPMLQADPMRMTQVLVNILDNAFRHTPQGGKIVIAASSQKSGVGLSVQDSGPGVDPGDLERIFDRFFRADPSRQREGGSGLGLAIAKSIVEMHAGEISAASLPGQGLTISIWLPLERSQPPVTVT